MLYFHGNGGDVAGRSWRLRWMASMGWGVMMPEYSGYGGNAGSPSEESFALEARSALAFLAREGVPGRRVVAYGESLGTGVAVRLASQEAVGALVLEAPFTSLADVAWSRLPILPASWIVRDKFDSLSLIASIRCPLFVIRGMRDQVVPPALGRRLYEAAREPKAIWTSPDAGHGDLYAFGGEVKVAAFVSALPPPPSRAADPSGQPSREG